MNPTPIYVWLTEEAGKGILSTKEFSEHLIWAAECEGEAGHFCKVWAGGTWETNSQERKGKIRTNVKEKEQVGRVGSSSKKITQTHFFLKL